jgi:hypothetical protein
LKAPKHLLLLSVVAMIVLFGTGATIIAYATEEPSPLVQRLFDTALTIVCLAAYGLINLLNGRVGPPNG